jgi:hypothetical protein
MRSSVMSIAALTLLVGAAALADSSASTSSNTVPPATSQIGQSTDVGDVNNTSNTGMEQAGTVDKSMDSTSPTTTTTGNTTTSVPVAGSDSMGATPGRNDMAKLELAPHAVMVESSLQNALIEVKAMRNQLKLTENSSATVPSGFFSSFKDLSKDINMDVKKAMDHNSRLESSARNHPNFVKGEDIRGVGAALSDVQRLNSTWQSKAGNDSYWRNKEQAKTDLDTLERRLNTAIDKARSFNSDKLELSTIG